MNDRLLLTGEFSKALARLQEGAAEDPSRSDLVVDGLIQRFEFTFELGWKLLKGLLHHQGIECTSPRSCVKEAAVIGLVADGDGWISMLEARNRTAHLYSRDDALTIYSEIKNRFVSLLKELEDSAAASLETTA
jgi:nucleotidyltransferase substrate binding protein (TIGR01987 family)